MKTKIYLSAILALGLGLTACNDDFLERAPKTELTEENAFQSYDNFKAFAWPLYEMFSNTMFGTAISGTGPPGFPSDSSFRKTESIFFFSIWSAVLSPFGRISTLSTETPFSFSQAIVLGRSFSLRAVRINKAIWSSFKARAKQIKSMLAAALGQRRANKA